MTRPGAPAGRMTPAEAREIILRRGVALLRGEDAPVTEALLTAWQARLVNRHSVHFRTGEEETAGIARQAIEEVRSLRERLAVAEARIANAQLKHFEYLPAAVDFDCCAECNRITGGYVRFENCFVRAALTASDPAAGGVA